MGDIGDPVKHIELEPLPDHAPVEPVVVPERVPVTIPERVPVPA